jgi:hypothetical protein
MEEKRTEIASLGEFGLIDHLTRENETKNASTLLSIGDDAAVIDTFGKQMVISTDMLLEGVHFDLMYMPLKHLGYKAVIVNLSDIYAMNAEPTQITLSIAISNRFSVEALDEFISIANKKKKTAPPGVMMMLTEDEYDAKKQEIISSIKCKMVHEDEIFIASNMTLWPCCFLWDSAFKNKENINDKLGIFEEGWNDLRKHSIDEIMAHPWFTKILGDSWDPDHPLHFARCVRTCAYNKAYQNEFNYKDKT